MNPPGDPVKPGGGIATERNDLPLGGVDAGVPIALLPVRLETIFDTAADPPLLKVRIYPDPVAADGLVRALTDAEHEAATAFWRDAWDDLASAVPAGWIDERLPAVRDLLAFVNAATADTLVPLPAVGDVRAAALVAHRPAGGYANLAEILALPDVQYGVLRDLLVHFAGPSGAAAVRAEVARVAVVPEPEALALWGWTHAERTAVLELANTAADAVLDTVPEFGPVTIRAIRSRRPLPDLFALAAVPGVGVGRLAALKDTLGIAPFVAEARSLATWRGLVDRFGVSRAAWAVRATTPTNAPRLGEAPRFPVVALGAGAVPTVARVLPDRFQLRGYREGRLVIDAQGAPISRAVQLGPDLTSEDALAALAGTDGSTLAIDRGMKWMVDYDTAVAQGMAITVKLEGAAAAALQGIDELVAYGVRVTADDDPSALAGLLEAHRYGRGLGFLAQGTPTNNTDDLRAPVADDDVDARFDGELTSSTLPANANGPRLRFALGLGDDAGFLDRVDGGADHEQDEQAAMNTLAWWGLLARTLGHVFTGEGGRALLSTDGQEWLRAFFVDRVRGGGPIPVLRVGRQPLGVLPVATPGWYLYAGAAAEVHATIERLRPAWTTAAADVPRLDPDRLDDLAVDGDVGAAADAALLAILSTEPHPIDLRVAGVEDRRSLDHNRAGIETQYLALRWFCYAAKTLTWPGWAATIGEHDASYADIEDQIATWTANRAAYEDLLDTLSAADRAKAEPLRDIALAGIDRLLALHQDRVAEARAVTGSTAGRPDGVVGEDDPRIVYALFDTADPARWGDARVDSPDDGAPTAASWLAWLAERCTTGRAGTVDDIGPFGAAARPLLWELARRAVDAAADDGAAALAALAGAFATLAALPSDRLDLRLRETLGLLGPRLDAWYTAVAWDELVRARAQRPNALQLGAWGFVEGLVPDRGSDLTRGFVHAPSLDHATAAAVLRAGWLAHGSTSATAPAAVDLSSDRMRTATELLGAMRRGQPIGAVLGWRFERGLRDAELSVLIHRYRAAVETATGVARAVPIDGELLLASRDHADVAAVGAALAPTLGPDASDRLDRVWDTLATSVDALADLLLAEGTFQLVKGNFDRASAVLAAAASGDAAPPAPQIVDTAPSGTEIAHRLILAWPTALAPAVAWAAGGDPLLEPFLASLFGDPAAIGFAVDSAGADGLTTRAAHTVGELGLSATAYVAYAASGNVAASATLAALVEERLGGALVPDVAPDAVTLADHQLLATAVRTLLARSRALVAADLADPATAPTWAPDAAITAVDLPTAFAANTGRDRAGSARRAEGWLSQVARVRPGVARWVEVATLAEALWPGTTAAARVAQWPDRSLDDGSPEAWAAVTRPAGACATTVVVGPTGAGPLAGIVVDEWSERIPDADTTTGVAFHVDSPAARAPAALLLAIAPSGASKWTDELLVATIREAIALARLRPVPMDAVEGFGHLVPLTFTTDPLTAPEAADG